MNIILLDQITRKPIAEFEMTVVPRSGEVVMAKVNDQLHSYVVRNVAYIPSFDMATLMAEHAQTVPYPQNGEAIPLPE